MIAALKDQVDSAVGLGRNHTILGIPIDEQAVELRAISDFDAF